MPKRKKSSLTAEERVAEAAREKVERKARLEKSKESAWIVLDKKTHTLKLTEDLPHDDKAIAKFVKGVTMLELFLHIVTPGLLTATWNFYDPTHWHYGSGRYGGTIAEGKVDLTLLYTVIAVYIRITGLKNALKENELKKRPLRNSIAEALDHYKTVFPFAKVPSLHTVEKLWARFLFPMQFMDIFSKRFQEMLLHPGRCIAGDEKLLHFTGDSAYIRLVPSKPDRIGLWFYELVAMLEGGVPFLLDFLLCISVSALGITTSVSSVVERWAKVAKSYQGRSPLLVFDSYYADNTSRAYLNESNVYFIASLTKERFTCLMDQLVEHGQQVDKPGDTSAIWNEESHEVFVHHWDANAAIGKKYVLSNAFRRYPPTRGVAHVVPAYDHYKQLFNSCDMYNRRFHERKYCHKTGGRNKRGEAGHVHKFIMACTLHNIFNLHKSVSACPMYNTSFKDNCLLLSEDIMAYALSMNVD